MTKKFDFIYEVITAVTSVIMMYSFAAAANSNVLSVIIEHFNNDGTSIHAQEYINHIFNEKEEKTEKADRTVYTANPLDSLTKTPDDILQLIKSAKESSANDIQDGKITEKHYEESINILSRRI